MNYQYHIKCDAKDVGRYAIICGDPDRVPLIAKYLDNAKQITHNREYNLYTGTLLGEKVTVCSHGIGGPSTAICVEELHNMGVDTIIRTGTCGGIDLDVQAGDIIVATGAVRFEHTSVEYAPIEYPAVANLDVTIALRDAARKLGVRFHTGVVHCKDSFYGQRFPEKSPVSYELKNKWESWKRLGVKCSEMESSALFVIGDALRMRCGACFHAVWNQEREAAGLHQEDLTDVTAVIRVSIEAMKSIIMQDKK